MSPPLIALAIALGVLVLLLAVSMALARLRANPLGDVRSGLMFVWTRFYLTVFHRMEVRGLEHVPQVERAGPLVVVANHTAGIDPLLIQVHCPFWIRWMMAQDMRIHQLEFLWRWAKIIFVDRSRGELVSVRESLRELRSGGVLGIFPEGGIERPPEAVRPFEPGVGMLIARSGARVLPVVIRGTPSVDPAWASLWHRSRAIVEFFPIIEYGPGMKPDEIARDLRARYMAWTGWPANDSPHLPSGLPARQRRVHDGELNSRQSPEAAGEAG